jgi:hypothetical protein
MSELRIREKGSFSACSAFDGAGRATSMNAVVAFHFRNKFNAVVEAGSYRVSSRPRRKEKKKKKKTTMENKKMDNPLGFCFFPKFKICLLS